MATVASEVFHCELSKRVWSSKYQYRDRDLVHDTSVDDTWQRVAAALAAVESNPHAWSARFYEVLKDFKFVPGGRILAGAGTARKVTLFNCFVMGVIEDSMDGIFDSLKEGAITMQQGGGVGYDFSTLRPAGTYAHSVGSIASGPVSFMRIWDSMCSTVLSTGARRGAMMATLRCDHPDIEQFIEAKKDANALRHFNLSVLVSDDFMEAIERDAEWPLIFPADQLGETGASLATVGRRWSGTQGPVPCRVLGHIRARDLWEQLMRATYAYAEPGILFVDRINTLNPLWYREWIAATNPCGEVPLPPHGTCNLGSLNVTRFVSRPFAVGAELDYDGLSKAAVTAVRMLDNVIDVSRYPLEAQRHQAQSARRVGLGITGLADTLAMMGLRYDSQPGRDLAARCMATIAHAAYRTSIELAREKGNFPLFDAQRHLEGRYIQSLPDDIREGILRHGMRNSHLLAIAPTGSISLLANNVSSGIEPIFDLTFTRRIVETDGSFSAHRVDDCAWRLWSQMHPGAERPAFFVTACDMAPEAHLQMQADLQVYVDQAISKTINIARDFAFSEFKDLYQRAYHLGLKGCTTYRPNPVTGEILSVDEHNIHCCVIEREGD